MQFWLQLTRRARLCVFLVSALFCPFLHAGSTAGLIDRLHRGEAATSIDLPTDKPWHLKIGFELFGDKQQVTDSGSIEEWWAPGKHRISIVSAAYKSVEVHNEQGNFRTPSTARTPYAIDELRTTVIHPMPSDLAIKDSSPELRTVDLGAVPLDCVMLSRKIGQGLSDGSALGAIAGLGLFPTYCFDRGKDSLRTIADSGTDTIILNGLGSYLGRSVAVKLSTVTAGRVTSRAHVDLLSSATAEQGSFEDVASLVRTDAEADPIDPAIMRGKIISKPAPVYPESARAAHISGTVLLRAIIGEDGHVRKLQAMQVPFPDLAIAAIQAVRQWVYSPYLVNGKPSEVETTITVNFGFSRR